MEQSQLHSFESRCVQDEAPPCQTRCPLHVEGRAFASLMAAGQLAKARDLLDRTMPLAGLMGYLCEGECILACRRSELDNGIDFPMLERACVAATTSKKPFSLPASGKKIAMAGGGLSMLVAAAELAKKGHAITVFLCEGTQAGGYLLGLDPRKLPVEALPAALERLQGQTVVFTTVPSVTLEWSKGLLDTFDAVLVGFDDPALDPAVFFAGGTDAARFSTSDITLETTVPRLFATCLASGVTRGKTSETTPSATPSAMSGAEASLGTAGGGSFIQAAAAGKRAAGSVTRLLQGASPAIAREKDVVYDSLLYTSLKGIETQPGRSPADPFFPSPDEARAEADRCIRCECLECVKVCPYMQHFKGYPKKMAREMYNNLAVVQGNRNALLVNSCAECGLCSAVCPTGADLGAFCMIVRSELVAKDYMPPSAFEFALEDMHFSSQVSFFRHQPGHAQSRYAFFPGCQLPAALPHEAESAYAHLCTNLKEGVALWFSCCGAPARWAGEGEKTAAHATGLRRQWEAAGKPEIIAACASCSEFFATLVPDIPVRSLWEVLAELPLPLHAGGTEALLAMHDPCASRGNEPMQDGARALAAQLGQPLEELPLSRKMTRCCGYGGLVHNANPDLAAQFATERGHDTDNILLVYCSMCLVLLRQSRKEALHLLSLLFPATGVRPDARALAKARVAGFSDRQEERARFRSRMLQTCWNESAPALPSDNTPESMDLIISDEVEAVLERRHILRSDIRNVLSCENSTVFVNAETGHALACFRPRKVSFWVEYSRNADNVPIIHDAYCHRMVVPGVPGISDDPAACDTERAKETKGCGC